MNKKIVIAGGSFAGVQAALKLANIAGFSVRLICPQSFFEYHAALYRTATGRSPLEVAIPLVDFFEFAKNVEIIEDRLVSIDKQNRVAVGESESKYHYDELILAIGNVTGYYNIPGIEKFAFGIKSIQEALRLKQHLHQQLHDQNFDHSYVVVGAGATGVELAAEMASYLKYIREKHNVASDKFSIYLVEAGPNVLGRLPTDFTDKVAERLKQLGIKLYLNTAVKSETKDAIKLPGETIKSQTVVWTAGVKSNPFFKENDFKMTDRDRVEVDKQLSVGNNIYVIGDSAATEFSGMAQTAILDAKFVAKNFIRAKNGQKPLSYKSSKPVYSIPVGVRWAAVLKGDKQYFGFKGWMLRRLTDLQLYRSFLPMSKAMNTWRYGYEKQEICSECKK